MRGIFQLCFELLGGGLCVLGHAADEAMSARIDAIQKANNGVHIAFTVFGAPNFVDVEGSATVDGIYRVENGADIITMSSGGKCAFIPASTDDRFFRVRLMSASVTNTLILPSEARNSFGNSWIPGFYSTPFQQIYAAAEFSDTPTDVIEINGMAWRLNEAASSMDATVPRLTIRMGIFRGAMSDLPSRGFIAFDFPATVVDRENVRLTATAGQPPNVFDVRIPFDTPYRYDRNVGQLVMYMADVPPIAGQADFDAVGGQDLLGDRGWIYLDDFPNSPRGSYGMIVTRFSYTAVLKP